jgi:hypothetical protein
MQVINWLHGAIDPALTSAPAQERVSEPTPLALSAKNHEFAGGATYKLAFA